MYESDETMENPLEMDASETATQAPLARTAE